MSRVIDQMERTGNATVLYGGLPDIQQDVSEWLNICLGIDRFDHLTEPNVQKVITSQCDDSISHLRNQVAHSIYNNKSDIVAVVGHHAEAQSAPHQSFDTMHKTVSLVANWQTQARVIGLWVNESGQIDMLMQH